MSSENIQVAVRFRPPSSPAPSIWSLSKSSILLRPEALQTLTEEKRIQSGNHPTFTYDFVFSAEEDNSRVYRTMVRQVVMSTLEGYNATVFAYGQTGSGKTFTMLGAKEEESPTEKPAGNTSFVKKEPTPRPESRRINRSFAPLSSRNRSLTPIRPDSPPQASVPAVKSYLPLIHKGIIVYALEDIFKEVGESLTKHYFFSCSYMEIYNERVFDLLKDTNEMKSEVLTIVENTDKDFFVRGLSDHPVSSISDVLSRLESGEINRHYAATSMNHNSSRSHTIFRLNIRSIQVIAGEEEAEQSERGENSENVTTESILNFVDLAGSERVGNIQPLLDGKPAGNSTPVTKPDTEKLLAESKNINTSLFYLCQVITKLAEMKLGVCRSDAHVPFRNSNLTKILRSSLGGNARTCILCTATPTMSHFEQTLSTLRFGSSARSITNKVRANVKRETSAQILMAYEQDVSVLRKELETLTTRNKAAISESSVNRQALEARIRKLTQLLYEKTRPDSLIQDVLYAGWTESAGDLISCEKVVESRGELRRKLTVRCDEDGEFAEGKAGIMRNMWKESADCLAAVGTAAESVKTMKESVTQQLATLFQSIERTEAKLASYESRLSSCKSSISSVHPRALQYECAYGYDSLSVDDLDALEATFLISLDRVKQEKSRLRVEMLISSLKKKLEKYVSKEEVAKISAEGGQMMLLKDLSTIQGDDSITSLRSMMKWESIDTGSVAESPCKARKAGV